MGEPREGAGLVGGGNRGGCGVVEGERALIDEAVAGAEVLKLTAK